MASRRKPGETVRGLARLIDRGLRAICGGALFMLSVNALAGAVEHWSFRPLHPIEPPPLQDSSWIQTPVDRFILVRLNRVGLKPSPPATREQLIRRASLGLIGLPPTAAE